MLTSNVKTCVGCTYRSSLLRPIISRQVGAILDDCKRPEDKQMLLDILQRLAAKVAETIPVQVSPLLLYMHVCKFPI